MKNEEIAVMAKFTHTVAYKQGLEHALRLIKLYKEYDFDPVERLQKYIEEHKDE